MEKFSSQLLLKKFWGYVLSYKINLLPSYFQEMQIQYQTSNIKANSLKWKAFPDINYLQLIPSILSDST